MICQAPPDACPEEQGARTKKRRTDPVRHESCRRDADLTRPAARFIDRPTASAETGAATGDMAPDRFKGHGLLSQMGWRPGEGLGVHARGNAPVAELLTRRTAAVALGPLAGLDKDVRVGACR